jgi:hypothetical protein
MIGTTDCDAGNLYGQTTQKSAAPSTEDVPESWIVFFLQRRNQQVGASWKRYRCGVRAVWLAKTSTDFDRSARPPLHRNPAEVLVLLWISGLRRLPRGWKIYKQRPSVGCCPLMHQNRKTMRAGLSVCAAKLSRLPKRHARSEGFFSCQPSGR